MEIPVLDAEALLAFRVEDPFPIVPEEVGTAWHYTDAHGFLGIVQSHQLWAAASLALNDTSEVTYGERILKSIWRNATKEDLTSEVVEFTEHVLDFEFAGFAADGLFILSASLDDDLLSQWRNYAGTDGFAIGIDMGVPLSILNPTDSAVFSSAEEVAVVEPPADQTPAVEPQWTKVIYDEEQQVRFAVEIIKITVQRAHFKSRPGTPPFGPGVWEDDLMLARNILLQAAALMKHPAFRDEREVRFLCGKKYAGNVESYRVRAGHIVPFLRVAANRDGDDRWSSDGSEPLPIVNVRSGPNTDSRGLQVPAAVLERNGYSSIVIAQSRIPIAL